ncbi:ACP S-malonyltransferase [Caryophanon tenue]|uniref:Malonyl CoA-acyl carrier protein transacylase n=1 Tax=Caryophanon tenue TaxID=33978 RepID=A0A1C0YKC9_9BACL|nr:ACP S-malonyltransferase [Caryophanon tenue]OCS87636.1 malonyl CoA-acyl carrier protein transacylase [Caryophanon tenue]
MNKIAFIFPGQGSQVVGMGAELAEQDSTLYAKADDILRLPLSTYMLEGPADTLTLTYHAQPALLTTGVMVAQRLQALGVEPDVVAGHSLGEYSALVTAGVMSFEEAVAIVHKRGLYMNEAVPAGEGAMAAILQMDATDLQQVTDDVTANGHSVQIANYNCPGQIVISGSAQGVQQACELAKERGAKRAIPLQVSGPFHSALMAPAAQQLQQDLQQCTFSEATSTIIGNVRADVLAVEDVQQELIEQVSRPVLWEQSVRKMLDLGVTTFIECGPGKVLSGLVKKVDRSATCLCVYDEATLQQAVEHVKGALQHD